MRAVFAYIVHEDHHKDVTRKCMNERADFVCAAKQVDHPKCQGYGESRARLIAGGAFGRAMRSGRNVSCTVCVCVCLLRSVWFESDRMT